MVKDVLGRMVEKPKYGGTITIYYSNETASWDEAKYRMSASAIYHNPYIYNWLIHPDYTKGPSGSDEYGYLIGNWPYDAIAGGLAASYEIPDDRTVIFHIRKGVHWQNKAPVNGREVTADDVVYTFTRNWNTPGSYMATGYKNFKPESITAPDKYTVVLKYPPQDEAATMMISFTMAAMFVCIYPHEVVETYGDLSEPMNAVGSGPFMIEDHVPNSSSTFVKNPNYWETDPFHPQLKNQLPYIDKLVSLVIPDLSTQIAALRTAKVDVSNQFNIDTETYNNIQRSTPELMERKVLFGGPTAIWWRVDRPPFDDIRLRKAMMLAFDNEAVVRDYYGGNAEIFADPWQPTSDHPYYVPLEDCPESIRELYEYHPDKAKELLAEAGYPNGIKFHVLCSSSSPADAVDHLSIMAAYLAKVGVEMEIDVREHNVYRSIMVKKTMDYGIYRGQGTGAGYWKFVPWQTGGPQNSGLFEDPIIAETIDKLFSPTIFQDAAKSAEIRTETTLYLLEQCLRLQFPVPYMYHMWWPWVKQYNGEHKTYGGRYNSFWQYPWVDQDLKEEMTGRR